MNAKAKGSRTEYKSIALLEAQGYKCTRAAASLGVFDIIAIGPTDIQLVQCKSNRWAGAEEMETMRQFPAPPNAWKLVHRWRDRQSEPDIRIVA
jgi:Holliday junction resolvase